MGDPYCIVVDNRERELIAALQKKGVESKLRIENLPAGDIVIQDSSSNTIAVIERKSVQDLAASIRDGRYKDQMERLSTCGLASRHVCFVIEGDCESYIHNGYGRPITIDSLRSALVRLTYDKGFSLFQTRCTESTADWLLHFAKRISTMTPSEEGYRGSMACKKDRATPESIFRLMLEQIPGVGARTAQAISLNYQTIAEFIQAIKQDPDSVADITSSGRRIGRKLVDTVAYFLREVRTAD